MRRGQNLSVQTLVIAALGVLVLIIAIFIYVKFSDGGSRTIEDCSNLRGQCMPSETCRDLGGTVNHFGKCEKNAAGEPQVCCTNT